MSDDLCNIIIFKAREYAGKAIDTPAEPCTVIHLPTQPEQEGIWIVGLALCLNCTRRWIASFDFMTTNLTTLECPKCGTCNSFVSILPNMGEGPGL